MKKQYILFLVVLLFGLKAANAQFTNIYTFDSTAYPYGAVTLAGNKLVGVAYEGGTNAKGFLFALNRDGSGYRDIWNFKDTGVAGNANGTSPYGNVTYINGRIYGFTYNGGANSDGLLFSIDTNGNGYKDLYDFNSSTGKYLGWGALTVVGNKFYGMTYEGGANNEGVVFSIDTNGANYRDLLDFNGSNGAYPEDVHLVVSKNKLYGMTYEGGANNEGIIFSIDTNGTGYTDLYDLNITGGYSPYGHLTLVDNKLYGMAFYGGVYDSGAIFSIDTNGSAFKVLYSFDSASGYFPSGSLTYARGKLYGMTYYGGPKDSGTVFSIDTNGVGYSDLVDFNGTNGAYPDGDSFTLSGDTLFGMTDAGGIKGDGNIFYYIDTNITLGVNPIQIGRGNIAIYPNPNNGQCTVACNVTNKESLVMEVYNMLGEKVFSGNLLNNEGNNQIDLSPQSSGIYLYRVITLTGTLVKEGKIVVNK